MPEPGLAILIAAAAAASLPVGPSPAERLAEAIAADDVPALVAALEAGAAVNTRLDYGETPLARAVEVQDRLLVAALLARGARANLADASGLTPLALACERGDAGIVVDLLAAGADPRRAGAEGASPLALCARFSRAEAVARMLALGAPVDQPDARGQTPLMWAASAGKADAAALLVKAGAKVNRVTPAGFTPLFFALAGGNADLVAMLVEEGADTGFRGPENTSALQMALYQKNWGAAKLLAARGTFDLAEIDRNGNRPLHVAAAAGEGELVAALLAAGADANARTGASRITWVTEANFGVPPPPVPPTPPLLSAAAAGQAGTMRQLVAAGADPRFVAANGTNVVLAAATSQSAEVLALALDLAPDVNVADADGRTPLHRVIDNGDHSQLAAMLAVLAARNARTDLPDARGRTVSGSLGEGLASVREAVLRAFPRLAAQLAVAGAPMPGQR